MKERRGIMTKTEKVTVKTDKQQPVKKVTYHDLCVASELLEQLKSWQEPLNLLMNFFADDVRPVNKKKVVRDYHACSQIFKVFCGDYISSVELMEVQINDLKSREKIQSSHSS